MKCDWGYCRTGEHSSVDFNFDSGSVVFSEEGQSKNTCHHCYLLRAGFASTPPNISDESSWAGPSVKLTRTIELTKGTQKKQEPLLAELQAVHTKNYLFIRAKIAGHSDWLSHAKIRLIGKRGKIFVPKETYRNNIATSAKQLICAKFALADLKSAYAHVPLPGIAVSAQMVVPDDSGRYHLISTSCDGEKHQGIVTLTQSSELPTLEKFNWHACDGGYVFIEPPVPGNL